MPTDYGNVSYTQLSHVGGGGPVLNIRNTTDRFEIVMNGIEFIDEPGNKKFLLELVKEFVPQYQKLNPYALALGFVAYTTSGELKKEGLIVADTLRKENFNYDGVNLSDVLAVSDILRYARLYQTLLEKQRERQPFEPAPVDESDEQERPWYDDDGDDYGDDYGDD